LYLRPSTSTRHLAHKDDILTKPDVGVDTTSSHYSSHTGRLNFFTHASDINECVAPKSYSTEQAFPTIKQWPITRLPEPAAFALVMAYTLLVLHRSLYWRSRHCSSKGGAVPPKVAFLAIVVAPPEDCKLGADIPLVRSPTLVALNPALLGRRLPRPLRLEMWPSIGLPPLLVPMPRPRWPSHSLLVWVLSFHLHFHLLHDHGLLHQGCKVLNG